jgi:hypothetical protein
MTEHFTDASHTAPFKGGKHGPDSMHLIFHLPLIVLESLRGFVHSEREDEAIGERPGF